MTKEQFDSEMDKTMQEISSKVDLSGNPIDNRDETREPMLDLAAARARICEQVNKCEAMIFAGALRDPGHPEDGAQIHLGAFVDLEAPDGPGREKGIAMMAMVFYHLAERHPQEFQRAMMEVMADQDKSGTLKRILGALREGEGDGEENPPRP